MDGRNLTASQGGSTRTERPISPEPFEGLPQPTAEKATSDDPETEGFWTRDRIEQGLVEIAGMDPNEVEGFGFPDTTSRKEELRRLAVHHFSRITNLRNRRWGLARRLIPEKLAKGDYERDEGNAWIQAQKNAGPNDLVVKQVVDSPEPGKSGSFVISVRQGESEALDELSSEWQYARAEARRAFSTLLHAGERR